MSNAKKKAWVAYYKDKKGNIFIRCKDGMYRNRPWGGTFGTCMSFHTHRGIKTIELNFWHGVSADGFHAKFIPENYNMANIWQATEGRKIDQ